MRRLGASATAMPPRASDTAPISTGIITPKRSATRPISTPPTTKPIIVSV